MIRERGITLEVCPTSNLNTRVVSGWDEFRWIFDTFRRNRVKYTINTDGPEMLKTYMRDELATLGRLNILSIEEQEQATEWARQASFVNGVSNIPIPKRPNVGRAKIERRGRKSPRCDSGGPRSGRSGDRDVADAIHEDAWRAHSADLRLLLDRQDVQPP